MVTCSTSYSGEPKFLAFMQISLDICMDEKRENCNAVSAL